MPEVPLGKYQDKLGAESDGENNYEWDLNSQLSDQPMSDGNPAEVPTKPK